ncbi:MAG: hypothetical protein HY433_00560 [Candidatus Liptonbacteria bacterium]|nr:hypothetical protein [Candidatus Liptonbacteria bacterium]
MLIFLCGPDDYRREEKKRSIIAEFRGKRGVSIDSFDLADKENFLRFQDFIKNQSLFAPDKFAILENAFYAGAEESASKKLAEELKQAAKQSGMTVLLSEKKPTEGFGFLSKKSAKVDVQKFDYLEGKEWEEFIAAKAGECGVKLGVPALEFLSRAYENDAWRLVTELQKISSLSPVIKNQDQPLGARELEKLGLEIAPNYFSLLQGLKGYQLENRMASLEKLFSMNEPLPKIFNMIIYQWPEKLGRLATYDILVKSGKLDYEEALLDVVL